MISIVICSIDDSKFSAVCETYHQALSGESFEIIGIHDAASMCEGYNRGIRKSRGELLVFSHDDIELIGANFAHKLKLHMQNHDLIGIAGTTRLVDYQWVGAGPPYLYGQVAQPNASKGGYDVLIWNATLPAKGAIQALDGVFLCARRTVAEKITFDEATFTGFHLYDLDFSFRAYQAGYKLAVVSDLPLIHASIGSFDETWAVHAERFLRKHHARLLPKRNRFWQCALVHIDSKEELLEVMGNSC